MQQPQQRLDAARCTRSGSPIPKGRDQVRISLTRSYRSPSLTNLIARPTVNTRYPVPGPEHADPARPRRQPRPASPSSRPASTSRSSATCRAAALLSANVFRRNISELHARRDDARDGVVRHVPRYVLRPQNVGDAVTAGPRARGEVPRQRPVGGGAADRRARQRQLLPFARQGACPAPDNRLDQQPDYTANLGADYRFAGLPLTLGGNLNWTPGLHDAPQRRADRDRSAGKLVDRRLWPVDLQPDARAAPVAQQPRRRATTSSAARSTAPTCRTCRSARPRRRTAPTYVNVQLRLELKL